MRLCLDVVDLLQLQEVWSRRPIVTAFTRLEPRPPRFTALYGFAYDDLAPRLYRLKHSALWQSQSARLHVDPARVALGDFNDDCFSEMYPEAESGAAQRHWLFRSAYNRFIVAGFCESLDLTLTALAALALARDLPSGECLGADSLPLAGMPDWIPASITDEIRSLDERYDPAQPGAPAAYVVGEEFWPLLIKATSQEVDAAAERAGAGNRTAVRQTLQTLVNLAQTWYRSPSVVGLCYQTAP